MENLNKYLICIYGEPASGKTTSLQGIKNQDKWLYICCEAGKEIPFKHNFKTMSLTDPVSLLNVFDAVTANKEIEGVIIDTLDFCLNMYEDLYISKSTSSTFTAWNNYGIFFRELMQDKVVKFGRPVIILAHNSSVYEDGKGYRSCISAKGNLKGNVEAYFNTIIAAKQVSLDELQEYIGKTPLLTINDYDEATGVKYVFQVINSKLTRGDRIRSPMGLFKLNKKENINETFIDNNIQIVIDRISEYYNN